MKIKRKKEKNNAYECTNALSEGRELTLNAFKNGDIFIKTNTGGEFTLNAFKIGIFPLRPTQGK